MANCPDERFISNLIELNKRADVDPEIIDLVAAYARLCLKDGKELNFYKEYLALSTNKPTIQRFIEKNASLDKRSLSFLVSYAEMMRKKRLPFLFNRAHLAIFLGTKEGEIEAIIQNKESYYHTFFIPKRNGDERRITAPKDRLKEIQKTILRKILEKVSVHFAARGFKRRSSIISNAHGHIGQEILVKMDIKDFFPSITYERVKGIFINLGYPEGVAEALTELTTYKGRLPMGASTSPYLSNIIAIRMDKRFTGLAKKMDFTYSRYADDLAFSSKDGNLKRHIPFFKEIIKDEGFEVNEQKVVIARKGGQQKVTGVVVNRKVNVEKREYKRLRAVIHNCKKGNLKTEMAKWGASNPGEYELPRSKLTGYQKNVNCC
ncbi:MAG: hypothetical protein A3D92_04585 [Bacteroidetes bacterium RIFCSPHIGHO2_02_FULL_44_7]|nr:MAG: hypothetical protein A3D92_04585 [Bacteroidetes bacterium RIFCSPHIGHO2_02_FULL_44_7]